MIKNFFSARLLVAALCVFAISEAFAQVMNSEAELPAALRKLDLMSMWLDAADEANFTKEGENVTAWKNLADENNPAVPTVAANGTDIVYGTVGITNNVSAFLMGAGGSRIDLGYTRLTKIRTVFWAMDVVDQMNGGFFLGDTTDNTSINFHRGEQGQYAYNNANCYFKNAETIVKCDGTLVADKLTEHSPAGLHVYSAVMSNASTSNRLSQDRSQAGRNGGRALSELIIYDVPLSATMVKRVEDYLALKWMNNDPDSDPLVEVEETTVKVSELNKTADAIRPQIIEFKAEDTVTLEVDESPKAATLALLPKGDLSLRFSSDIAATQFFEKAEFGLEGKVYPIASLTGAILFKADGSLEIEGTLELDVPYGEELRINSLKGGKLVKTGDGTLRIGRVNNTVANVDGTTIDIKAGKVLFHQDDGAIFLKTSTYILHDGAQLDNYGWPKVEGTLTFESDNDVTIFTNNGGNTAEFEGEHIAIVKRGTGRIDLKCGSSNDNVHHNIISSVVVEGGTLAFSGIRAKVITSVSGAGTLEEAGGGAMTISTIAPETSLKVSAGAVNNECSVKDGSLTLAGLEIAAGATYTMNPAIDHLTITKAFYLEGEVHKNWYVTLGDGATIATNPENPMTLAGLEFGNSAKLGPDQSIGSILANVIKPKNMPEVVTSEDERLAKVDFNLDYLEGCLVIASELASKAQLEVIPGSDLNGATYRVYLPLPPVYEGKLRSRITTPYSSATSNVKYDSKLGKWYAEVKPVTSNEAKGQSYPIKVEIGTYYDNKFTLLYTYEDVTLNVRDDSKDLIDEEVYDRWETGTWDTEGEYITISEGYVQIEGKKVSFVPGNPNEEAATKLHFTVKFCEAMKLAILNAIADEGQIAGIGLVKAEDGAIGYAAWDPSAKEYVSVTSSDKKPIDVTGEHLVEVTLTKSGVAYNIDGVALVTADESKTTVFELPKTASIEIAEIDFEGKGAVKSMTAEEYSTKLAEYNGQEYATVGDAIKEALDEPNITITPLWNSKWNLTAELAKELENKTITFDSETYKVIVPSESDSALNKAGWVLRNEGNNKYTLISKYLTVSIPDPEDNDGFGVFLESVTTNSMHLGWVYEYPSSLAKATVVFGDDVTVSFSTTIENKGLLVSRENTNITLESVTFKDVRYNIEVGENDIPVLDKKPVAAQQTMAKFGVAKQDVIEAKSVGILDFTTAADGVTFTVGLLDAQGNDITKIVSEQIGEMVKFSTDLKTWTEVGAENVKVITNEDGVQVMFAQQKDTTTGFYKVVIPSDAK